MEYGTEHIAGGVETGIEGGIHAMHFLWAHHSQEEDWGFILTYERNKFNGENWTAMIWAVRHE